ncbi:hypothetical protein [Massilia sp. Root418]|jgi:DNA-damage-inducible protein J|uniref:antitoxin PaaA2 family protein n=1 Tax=Massilia sp. Root418 TaxID=1736532 RepID=UPI000A97EF78|nr:hypothetical protein [Massilia sp. Root418]
MTAGSKNNTAPALPTDADDGYDEWLAAEVEEAINDPRPSVPGDEVERHFAARRAALTKRIKGD